MIGVRVVNRVAQDLAGSLIVHAVGCCAAAADGSESFHYRNGDKPSRAGRDDLLRRAGGATCDGHRTTRRCLPARAAGDLSAADSSNRPPSREAGGRRTVPLRLIHGYVERRPRQRNCKNLTANLLFARTEHERLQSVDRASAARRVGYSAAGGANSSGARADRLGERLVLSPNIVHLARRVERVGGLAQAETTGGSTVDISERPTPLIRPGDGDPRHGSGNGYSNLGCRCERCRRAWALTYQKRRERKRSEPTPVDAHGTVSGYSYWGCRCPKCTAVHNERHREQRSRQRSRRSPKSRPVE